MVTLIIETNAKLDLKKLYLYIKEDSPKNAIKVKATIIDSFKKLIQNPQFFPPDKYKLNADECYRAYEIYSYRIAYFVGKKEIRILRIRHTKMNPSFY